MDSVHTRSQFRPSPETNEAEGITHGLHQQQRELLCLSLTCHWRYWRYWRSWGLRAVRKTRTRGRALPEILTLALHLMHSIQFLSICHVCSVLKLDDHLIILSSYLIPALCRFSVLLETWEWDSASSPPQRFTLQVTAVRLTSLLWCTVARDHLAVAATDRYRVNTEAVASIASNVVLGSWIKHIFAMPDGS